MHHDTLYKHVILTQQKQTPAWNLKIQQESVKALVKMKKHKE